MEEHRASTDWTEARWTRSPFCGDSSCLEIARAGDDVALRDSNDPDRIIVLTADDFRLFARGMKAGAFDNIL